MRRAGVSNAIAAGLLVVGILIGAVGFYESTTYQTKTMTQTETTTARLTTTATVTLPGVGTEFVYGGFSQNSSIYAAVDETFVIQFSSNAYDSGYAWNVNTSAGIQYLNNTVVPFSSMCAGCPQTYDYYFRAVQVGTQTITLQAKRPFAPYDIAATINLTVVVPSYTTTNTGP
jgi:inhibitor of cysteine peptidase